jgi:hypothetical protein
MLNPRWAFLLLLPLSVGSCSDGDLEAGPGNDEKEEQIRPDGGAPDSGGPSGCVPGQTAFAGEVGAILDRKCGKCHGETTNFGAPFSLESYSALLAGNTGQRIVDRMTSAVKDFRMPPPGNPQLTQAELDTLLGWASCGTARADYSRGLTASRPVWESPPEPSANLRRIDLVASEYAVATNLGERYESFYFQNLVDKDQFIRRFDAVLDESRVVHHITIHYRSDDSYLYAWAPGTGAVEFPEGGLRLRPSDSFRLEIHYNNTARLENLKDSSGVAFYVADPSGTEYAMADPTTFRISVPPQAEATASKDCTATRDFKILAGMPHMHQIGKSFLHEVVRANGTVDKIISLDGWSFELQYFYDLNVTVNKGDTLRLRCTYENPTDQTVVGGLKTTDEMCYNFMYVTPPEAGKECEGLL